jgi:hypothetical protein
MAASIEEDLDLHVPSPFDEPLEEEAVVGKRDRGLAAGGIGGVAQPTGLANDTHPLAATPGRRLDQERVPDPRRGDFKGVVRLIGVVVALGHRHTQRPCQPTGCRLVAHQADRGRRRPHPAQPGVDDALREVGILGQEPEAGVDRVGARCGRRRHHRVRVEQVQAIRSLRGRCDGADPEALARSGDPRRDLAAVGDEQRPDGAGHVPGGAGIGSRCRWSRERVNRANRDTPPAPDAPCG